MEKRATFFALSLVLLSFLTTGALADAIPLATEDCAKCHDEIVADVTTRGAKHLTAVSCLDCHLEHPPKGSEVIPECAMCHDPAEKAHYTIDNCSSCHYPHYPLEIDLDKTDVVKPVCVSCHENEGTQLTNYPSMHSELDCKECHLQHGQFLVCLECHEPHTDEMVYEDCITCHQPHKPTVVKYPDNIQSSYCAGCHEQETAVLASNTTKHHDLTCAYCHKMQHKMVPQCTTCHGTPHDSDLHKKFPDCVNCHVDPHGLEK